jgi:trimethylamine--corrinoid protein Co-methyltransferase
LPGIAEAGPYETWAEGGRRTAEERANGRWKKMLADYEAPPIDRAIEEALQEFVARRKAALPDEWY